MVCTFWQVGITSTRMRLDLKSYISCSVLPSTSSGSRPSLLMPTTFSVSQVCILFFCRLFSSYVSCKYFFYRAYSEQYANGHVQLLLRLS